MPVDLSAATKGDVIVLAHPVGPAILPPPVNVTTPVNVALVVEGNRDINVKASSTIDVIDRLDSSGVVRVNLTDNVRVSGELHTGSSVDASSSVNITGGSGATYQHWGASQFNSNATASIDANLTGCGTFTLASNTTLELAQACGASQDFYLHEGVMIVDHGASFAGHISLDTSTEESANGGAHIQIKDAKNVTSYSDDHHGHLLLKDSTGATVQTLNVSDRTGGNYHVEKSADGGVEITTGAPPPGAQMLTQTTTATTGINTQNLALDTMTFINTAKLPPGGAEGDDANGSGGGDATDSSSITGTPGRLTFTSGADADIIGINGRGVNTVINFHASDVLTIATHDYATAWAEVDNGRENSLILTATSKTDPTLTATVQFQGYTMADLNTRLMMDTSSNTALVVTAVASPPPRDGTGVMGDPTGVCPIVIGQS